MITIWHNTKCSRSRDDKSILSNIDKDKAI